MADRIAAAHAGHDDRRWRATLSCLVHVMVVAGLARVVLPAPPSPPADWAVPLMLAPLAPAPPPATTIASADLPPPAAVGEVIRLAPLRPFRLAAAPPRMPVVSRLVPPAPRSPALVAPPPPASAAAAPHAVPDAGWVTAFTGRVQAAVQAAAMYPMAARAMHRQGRVRIRFDYAAGAPGAPEILIGSSEPMLDRAAIRAVQSAAYPPVPPALGGARLKLLVWVDFRLAPES